MHIENGVYIIFDYRGSGLTNPPIGRYPIEDMSLKPKPVFALPGTQGFEMPKWIVEKKDKGYRLKAFGSPVGVHNDYLHAFLLDEQQIEDWEITYQPQHGKDIVTIEKQDKSAGWVVQENQNMHEPRRIAIKPLKSSKSNPPQYPDEELFTMIRVDKD